jgi:hypothetical protein
MRFTWIVICLMSLPAWGYQFTPDFTNGFYWLSLPIKITVLDKDGERKKMLEDLSQAAIHDWEDSSGLKLWDFSEDGASAGVRNIIRWSDNFATETNMDPDSVLAVAIRYTDGPYFAKTEIVINGNHQLNRYENYLRTTLTHELGHTMGLDHSEERDAVMAPTLQAFYTGLHDDDIKGLNDAHVETLRRQTSGYVSPLAYETEQSAIQQPVSCGTVATAPVMSFQNLLSLAGGILISFIRKILQWFKSRL